MSDGPPCVIAVIITAAAILITPPAAKATTDPCYLPRNTPARVAPAGMDNYMWPPCEPYPPPPITTTECVFPSGNPDGTWCWYTNPANGKKYMRWGYHSQ